LALDAKAFNAMGADGVRTLDGRSFLAIKRR
jgi:hypothetical protein